MLSFYLRSSLRNLRINKSFSAINIIGLSVGMAAAVLIFMWASNEKQFDRFHPNSDRIYRITSYLKESKWVWETTPLSLAGIAEKEVPEIEKITMLSPTGSQSFQLNSEIFLEEHCAYVDKQWFDVFKFDFIMGNSRSFVNNPFSLILTEKTAKKYFGSENPVGKVLRKDSIDYMVRGVIRNNPSNSSFQFELIMPLDAYLSDPDSKKNASSWGNFNFITFVLLKEQTKPGPAASKLSSILVKNKKSDDVQLGLTPLQDMHFETELTGNSRIPHMDRKVVQIFSILGLVLLTIACINYINLTTGKASLRAREVSVKKIVGARRSHLMMQFLFDSLIVSFISLVLSILIIYLLIPGFSRVTERNFENALSEWRTWKILVGTLLVTAILNGIYPAIMLSSFKPLNIFKGVTVLNVKDAYLRKGLVVVQFVLSVVMVISTIVIFQQLKYIQEKKLGYNHSQILSFNFPYKVLKNLPYESWSGYLNKIKTEFQSQSIIKQVSLSSESAVNIGSSTSGSADWDGHDTTFSPTIFRISTDVEYKDVFELEMKDGRWFKRENEADKRNVVLNETAVQTLGLRKPYIGQRFKLNGDEGQVIGIVKDFHFKSLHEKIQPLGITHEDFAGLTFFLKLHPGKNAEGISLASKVFKKHAPGIAFEYSFEDENFDNLYKQDKRISSIILSFAILAIIISVLDLFGLSAFAIDQRRKEIGIRKVLGATIVSILTLLSKDFVKLVFVGIVIAAPVSWWAMSKWLQGFAYRIDLSAWYFIVAGLLAISISIITICSQSLRAVSANPVKSLRTE